MRGDTDTEAGWMRPDGLDQLEGVGVVAAGIAAVRRRITAEGENVLDAGSGVLVEETSDVVPCVTDAREMGHARERLLAIDAQDHVAGAIAGRAERAVRHRHERRGQKRELGERLVELTLHLVGLRWEELERACRARL